LIRKLVHPQSSGICTYQDPWLTLALLGYIEDQTRQLTQKLFDFETHKLLEHDKDSDEHPQELLEHDEDHTYLIHKMADNDEDNRLLTHTS
jgi:hypothetical protein